MRPARGVDDTIGRVTIATVCLAVGLVFLLAGAQEAPGRADAQPPGGWFTEAQAERGRESYIANCARCHSRDLNARSTYISLYTYPSLKGAYFLDRWQGESVHTLYQVVRHTMPLDAPGSLDEETYADIVAYVLQENGFPAGGAELPLADDDAARLRGMVIEPANMVTRPGPQRVEPVTLRESGASRGAAAAPSVQQGGGPPPVTPLGADQPQGGAWFTEQQAVRAEDQYSQHCARCHGRALQGVGVAPSLAGGNFMERWEAKTVADLFVVASTLMPLDGQGELQPQVYADLVAYILWRNGFPHADAELPIDPAALEQFVITSDLAEVPEVP